MSCVELTPRMVWLLETLGDYPLDADQLDRLRLRRSGLKPAPGDGSWSRAN